MQQNKIIFGNNLDVLESLPSAFARMIYVDPPFNTGVVQKRTRIKVSSSDHGKFSVLDRTGFGGRRYGSEILTDTISKSSYQDKFSNFEDFLIPRIEKSIRCLTDDGSIFVHLDYREVHYIKVALDKLLGREKFMNEIIWSFDYGARSKKKWPTKHNTILWYALNPNNYVFNYDGMDRIPYLAPGLVGAEKAARGKTPTDCWQHTIVPTNSKEKTGYPTQKPVGIIDRLVKVHTNSGDTVLDFFCGSGTTGFSAAKNNRSFVLIDNNPEAIAVCASRLSTFFPELSSF